MRAMRALAALALPLLLTAQTLSASESMSASATPSVTATALGAPLGLWASGYVPLSSTFATALPSGGGNGVGGLVLDLTASNAYFFNG